MEEVSHLSANDSLQKVTNCLDSHVKSTDLLRIASRQHLDHSIIPAQLFRTLNRHNSNKNWHKYLTWCIHKQCTDKDDDMQIPFLNKG